MGRFLSPDWAAKAMPVPYAVMGDPQSLNLYAYVRNNPLSRTDATGHCGEGPNGWICDTFSRTPCWCSGPQQSGFQGFGGGSTGGGGAGFGGAGAGGSWGPEATPQTSTASSTPSRVRIPGYGGTATVAAGAAPFIGTQSADIDATIPYVDTPYGAAFQEYSSAAQDALADVQSGATLYRQGTFGIQETTGAQFWSLDNPATTSGYAANMGMLDPAAEADWYMGARLVPGASVITRVAAGGTAIEAVTPAEGAVDLLWFVMP